MLNYETLLSSYDDKLTLMQWLKKVEAALKDASAVAFNVTKTGDATLTFSVDFEDGSKLESGPIVLQQGESVASAAITNGHLFLTLTNGDVLDAGSLFNGDVSITGNLQVSGSINGESDPSVKPLYYHPVYVLDLNESVIFTCVIINNDSTPYDWGTFKAFIESNNYFALQPISGTFNDGNNVYSIHRFQHTTGGNIQAGCFNQTTGNINHVLDFTAKWNALFTGPSVNTEFQDLVNKIN